MERGVPLGSGPVASAVLPPRLAFKAEGKEGVEAEGALAKAELRVRFCSLYDETICGPWEQATLGELVIIVYIYVIISLLFLFFYIHSLFHFITYLLFPFH